MDPKVKAIADAINLDDYRKDNVEKMDLWTTSLTLEKRHQAFLNTENLNLSKLVRDLLDALAEKQYSNDAKPKG